MADGDGEWLAPEEFHVVVTMTRTYYATIKVWATDQSAADRMALERFDRDAYDLNNESRSVTLHLPAPWDEHECSDADPKIDTRYRCVDCTKDTFVGEYYGVSDELWASAGMAPDGGMLCLACLEGRVGRELTFADFDHLTPSPEAWERHLRARPDG